MQHYFLYIDSSYGTYNIFFLQLFFHSSSPLKQPQPILSLMVRRQTQ